MTPRVTIDPASPVPPFEQLRALVASGLVLAAGRRGSTVAPGSAVTDGAEVEAAARAFLGCVRRLGGDVDTAVAAVRAVAGTTT